MKVTSTHGFPGWGPNLNIHWSDGYTAGYLSTAAVDFTGNFTCKTDMCSFDYTNLHDFCDTYFSYIIAPIN